MAAAPSFVDTRLDLKTPNFDGTDASWEAWCLKFEAYGHLVGLGPIMEGAAASADPIDVDVLTDAQALAARNLYALLISKCDGRALSVVALVASKNGAEAWRRLKAEYEGHGGARIAAMLRGILNPRSRWSRMHSEGRDLNELLQAWDRDIAQYRLASNSALADDVMVATLFEHLPGAYTGHAAAGAHGKSRYVRERTLLPTGVDAGGAQLR